MTSLAQQLKRLAVPQTQAVFSDDRRRVSLLFDPKDAASLDREAIFAIGQSGLEELQNVDEKFVECEQSLFAMSSQTWERSLQSREVNQQLDDTIQEFLIILSPYFPLKSAHKALEWLIFRYHIHNYNRDDLLLCVLPYHEMNIFVRVLQLLKLEDPTDKWHWLHPAAKSGVALARGTLINHCTKDPGFMAFILKIVPKFIKIHGAQNPQLRAVIAFYTCAMLGALQDHHNITNKMMSIIVPHLVTGFQTKCVELRAANLMIMSQLVVQVQLKSDLLVSLIPVLSKRIATQLTQESLACLSLIFQVQKIPSMPKKTFKHICKVPGIIELLSRLSLQYDMDKLLRVWVQQLIPKAVKYGESDGYSSSSDGGNDDVVSRPAYGALLHGVLTEVKIFSDKLCAEIARDIVSSLLEHRQNMMETEDSVATWRGQVNSLLLALENRHTKALDLAVQETMSKVQDKKTSLIILEEMMSLTSSPIRYQAVPGTTTSLLIGLKHHSPTIRILTLGHVSRYILENEGSSTEFLVPLLLERLEDNVPEVVKAVFNLNEQQLLTKILPADMLMPILSALVKRTYHKGKWYSINASALEILCGTQDKEIIYDLLKYLLILKPKASVMTAVIFNHACGELADILMPVKDEWLDACNKKGKDVAFLNTLVVKGFGQYLDKLLVEQKLEELNTLVANCQDSSLYKLLMICALSDLAKKAKDNKNSKVKVILLEHLLVLVQAVPFTDEIKTKAEVKQSKSGNIKPRAQEKQMKSGKKNKAENVKNEKKQSEAKAQVSKGKEESPRGKIQLEHQRKQSKEKHPDERSEAAEKSQQEQSDADEEASQATEEQLEAAKMKGGSTGDDVEIPESVEMEVEAEEMKANSEKQQSKVDDVKNKSPICVTGRESVSDMMLMWVTYMVMKKRKLPPSLGQWALFGMIRSLEGYTISDEECDFITDHQRAAPVIHLLDMLISLTMTSGNMWRPSVVELTTELLPLESILPIFHYIWMMAGYSGAPTRVSADLHMGSFYLFGHLLEHLDDEKRAAICSPTKPTITCIILALCHPEDCVPSVVNLMSKVKVTCAEHLGTRRIILKKLIGRPHVPHLVLKKLYNSLLNENKNQRKVSRADLDQVLHWLKVPHTPALVKHNILHILRMLKPQTILNDFIPMAMDLISRCSSGDVTMDRDQMSLLKQMLDHICGAFDPNLPPEVRCADVLFSALRTSDRCSANESPQDLAIDCLDLTLFNALSDLDLQRRMVSALLDIGEKHISHDLSAKLKTCMIGLHLRGSHVLHEIDVKDMSEVTTVKGKKRSRLTHAATPLKYSRLTLILEVIQGHKKVKDREELAAALFSLLGRLIHETHDETEFCKQLVLTSLLSICSQWREKTKPQKPEILKVEDLVQCIRTSPSPQTQQQAMMVMTAIAPLYPEYILHHVMSIFTFMGSNMLQQDDAYSFHIITKTLDTIIPALIKACADRGVSDTDEETLIRNILRVFVDARHHIPKHRCTILFRQLAERVGLKPHLWTIMVLQMESAIRTKDVPLAPEEVVDIMEEDKSMIDKDIDLLYELSRQFDVSVQLHSMTEVIRFLIQLSDFLLQQSGSSGQLRKVKKVVTVPIVTTQSLSPQQLRLLQFHTTRLITYLMGAHDFISGIHDLCVEGSMPGYLQQQFQNFVQQCLSLLTHVAKGHGALGNTATAKFWRAALYKVYEILEKVNVLLPNNVFLTVVSSLLDHDILMIRRKSLELLNNKMQMVVVEQLSNKEIEALLDIVPRLQAIVVGAPPQQEALAEYTTLRQMALHSLKLLCKLLGPLHPGKFIQLFDVSLTILGADDELPAVVGGALLCIAELCNSVKAQALPYLPKFMPPLIALLKHVNALKMSDVLMVCSLTALQKTVGSLPHFLSPYLLDILTCVCQVTGNIDHSDTVKKSQPVVRLKAVRHQLSTAVASRVLVPTLTQTLETLIEHDQKELLPLFGIAQDHIGSMEKEALNAQHNALITFFCQSLDLRNTKPQLSSEELDIVENEAIQPVLTMVMKLSENTFKPMYCRLYDWACREETDVHKNRRISFFRLSDRLSDKLKSLFNLFIGTIVKSACDQLQQNNTKNGEVTYFGTDDAAVQKSCLLLGYTISCLHKCFMHDTEGLVTKEMFTTLLHPLVDQLENMIGGDSAYEERVTDHVMPCISQLGVASRDDSLWKSLNYQVLLKTRHASPKVRFATLQVVEDLANKLGEEYMTLLPETVPFLAELMEDESEEVEQKCQQVISSMEAMLGESLQQYF